MTLQLVEGHCSKYSILHNCNKYLWNTSQLHHCHLMWLTYSHKT